MSWCLADVVDIHGDVGLGENGNSRVGCWDCGRTPVVYPDLTPTIDSQIEEFQVPSEFQPPTPTEFLPQPPSPRSSRRVTVPPRTAAAPSELPSVLRRQSDSATNTSAAVETNHQQVIAPTGYAQPWPSQAPVAYLPTQQHSANQPPPQAQFVPRHSLPNSTLQPDNSSIRFVPSVQQPPYLAPR